MLTMRRRFQQALDRISKGHIPFWNGIHGGSK